MQTLNTANTKYPSHTATVPFVAVCNNTFFGAFVVAVSMICKQMPLSLLLACVCINITRLCGCFYFADSTSRYHQSTRLVTTAGSTYLSQVTWLTLAFIAVSLFVEILVFVHLCICLHLAPLPSLLSRYLLFAEVFAKGIWDNLGPAWLSVCVEPCDSLTYIYVLYVLMVRTVGDHLGRSSLNLGCQMLWNCDPCLIEITQKPFMFQG